MPREMVGASWCAGFYSKRGIKEGIHITPAPKLAVSLAVIYPPPAELECLLGQGQEVTVEET